MNISPLELAWLAGLVDGEGCLTCGYRSDNRGIRLTFSIEMTHKPTIERIKGYFPNFGYYRRVRKQRRDGFRIELRNKQAIPVIQALLPHLVTKKEEALVWLELAETVTSGGPNHKISEDTKNKRDTLISRLRELKRLDFT